jgi:hypothetical protein
MAIAAQCMPGVKNVWCSSHHIHFIIFRDCIIQHKALGGITFEYIPYYHFLNDGRTNDYIAKFLSVS